MTKTPSEAPIIYVPDSPNVGDVAPAADFADPAAAAADRAQADDLATKVAIADELSEYEIVAGKGVP